MTKDSGFKKVVRRHAAETGQRYTEALTDLQGLEARMSHEPVVDRLLDHLRHQYGIEPSGATQLSQHNSHVFRIDRTDGSPWVARAFPPARPRSGAEGDAEILRFLKQQGYPAERLAIDDAVSDFDGSSVLVTEFVESEALPPERNIEIMADLLGRLHALPLDGTVTRPGGAGGDDPSREGGPRQDLLAALSFLDSVATKVPPAKREEFERVREVVGTADVGEDLPQALVHGNLMHAPDHAIVGPYGPVAINWKSAGRGPRLTDFAFLMWGTWLDQPMIEAGVAAYRNHVEVTADELDRFEAMMSIRLLERGQEPQVEWWDPDYIKQASDAVRSAFAK